MYISIHFCHQTSFYYFNIIDKVDNNRQTRPLSRYRFHVKTITVGAGRKCRFVIIYIYHAARFCPRELNLFNESEYQLID